MGEVPSFCRAKKKAVEILSAAFVCTVAKPYGAQSIEWPQFH